MEVTKAQMLYYILCPFVIGPLLASASAACATRFFLTPFLAAFSTYVLVMTTWLVSGVACSLAYPQYPDVTPGELVACASAVPGVLVGLLAIAFFNHRWGAHSPRRPST